jgi:hypothetical protein
MEVLLKILIVAGIIFVVWLILQPRYLFAIQIKNGKARRLKGRVPGGFMEDVEHISQENALTSGSIRGIARGKRIGLSFSRQIPRDVCQKLRNAWNLHR